MEHNDLQSVERLICDKILLYDELLTCFKEERDSLINIDLDKLWLISRKKTELCSKIKDIRKEIFSSVNKDTDGNVLELNRIVDLAPSESKPRFNELFLRLIRLKTEIDVLRKENKSFMDDSLRFLDEMVSIIAGGANPNVYNDKCHMNKPGINMLVSREV